MAYNTVLGDRLRKVLQNRQGISEKKMFGGLRPMDFTGRPMKGFLYVSPKGYKTDQNLLEWIERGIDFTSTPKK